MKDLTANDIKNIAEKANAWISSEEGQTAIKKALEKADQTIQELEQRRRVSWEDLHRPMNI